MCGAGGTHLMLAELRGEKKVGIPFWTTLSKDFASNIASVMHYSSGNRQYFWVSYLGSRLRSRRE